MPNVVNNDIKYIKPSLLAHTTSIRTYESLGNITRCNPIFCTQFMAFNNVIASPSCTNMLCWDQPLNARTNIHFMPQIQQPTRVWFCPRKKLASTLHCIRIMCLLLLMYEFLLLLLLPLFQLQLMLFLLISLLSNRVMVRAPYHLDCGEMHNTDNKALTYFIPFLLVPPYSINPNIV